MIFIFNNLSYYNYYRAVEHPIEFRNDIKEEIDAWNRLLDILEKNYPSIEFCTESSTDFKFNDPSDEAAFLLWSSQGVDI